MTRRSPLFFLAALLASSLSLAAAEDRDVWLLFYPAPAAGVDKFYTEKEYITWTAHPDNQGGQTAGSICGASTPDEILEKEKDNNVDGTLSKPCANAIARLRKEYRDKYLKEDGIAREHRLKGYLDKLLEENKLEKNHLRRDDESDQGWYFPPQDERRKTFQGNWVEMSGLEGGRFPALMKSGDGIKFVLSDLDTQSQDFVVSWNPPLNCRPVSIRGNSGGDSSDNSATVQIPSMLNANGASSALMHLACSNSGINPDGTQQTDIRTWPRVWATPAKAYNLIHNGPGDAYVQPSIAVEPVSSGSFAAHETQTRAGLNKSKHSVGSAQRPDFQ